MNNIVINYSQTCWSSVLVGESLLESKIYCYEKMLRYSDGLNKCLGLPMQEYGCYVWRNSILE